MKTVISTLLAVVIGLTALKAQPQIENGQFDYWEEHELFDAPVNWSPQNIIEFIVFNEDLSDEPEFNFSHVEYQDGPVSNSILLESIEVLDFLTGQVRASEAIIASKPGTIALENTPDSLTFTLKSHTDSAAPAIIEYSLMNDNVELFSSVVEVQENIDSFYTLTSIVDSPVTEEVTNIEFSIRSGGGTENTLEIGRIEKWYHNESTILESFADWETAVEEIPTPWNTSSIFATLSGKETKQKSENSVVGDYALRLETIEINLLGTSIGMANATYILELSEEEEMPAELVFHYDFTPENMDNGYILMSFFVMSGDEPVEVGEKFEFLTPTNGYEEIVVPLEGAQEVPELIQFTFSANTSADQEAIGNVLYIDDVKLRGTQTSMSPTFSAENATIYPNPASGYVNIEITMPGDNKAELYNTQGQKVVQATICQTNCQIDVSNLEEGIYILQINSQNGTYRDKIMVR